MEERRNRTARRILKGTVYPHNIHPALDFYHAGSGLLCFLLYPAFSKYGRIPCLRSLSMAWRLSRRCSAPRRRLALVLCRSAVALRWDLSFDPAVIRYHFEEQALANAVVQGVREHGDDFALSVEQTERNSEYSTGAEFDSTSEEATEWYVRTDEEGEPIPYDYEASEYISKQEVVDGWEQDT